MARLKICHAARVVADLGADTDPFLLHLYATWPRKSAPGHNGADQGRARRRETSRYGDGAKETSRGQASRQPERRCSSAPVWRKGWTRRPHSECGQARGQSTLPRLSTHFASRRHIGERSREGASTSARSTSAARRQVGGAERVELGGAASLNCQPRWRLIPRGAPPAHLGRHPTAPLCRKRRPHRRRHRCLGPGRRIDTARNARRVSRTSRQDGVSSSALTRSDSPSTRRRKDSPP